MAERLNDTVALVTGASSGIGRATAIRLAASGAKVALAARRADRLIELASEIRAQGGEAIVVAADISIAEECDSVVARTVSELGRIDTLVNAAGAMMNGPTLAVPVAAWDKMLDVNLRALLYMTRAALPHLLEAVGSGQRKVADVVNISSVAGRSAEGYVAVYNATKFAVTAATEAWRQEFTRQSVRFSVIEPGAVKTELWAGEGQLEGYKHRFGEVEWLASQDIADAVSYIVGNPRHIAVNEIVIRPTDQA
jgi:NADP-dependent 3-hydroxy acid dehydrogenase YdfG